MKVSVLILTRDEQDNLPDCLESVAWSDDIVVFDSYSVDRTIEIARAADARVIQRRFDNWSSHLNWALDNIEFKYPWLLQIDADERCDSQLRNDLAEINSERVNYVAFQVRRKDYFMGKWIRRAQLYPSWMIRLFRHERIRFERLVNPTVVVDGRMGWLEGHILHHPFSHGIAHWFARHNNYSTMEAIELVKEVKKRTDCFGILSLDYARRRKALKQLAYKMPCRPFVVFAYLFFLRRSFLEGRPGIYYAFMRAVYEYMIDLKVRESRRRKKGLPL